MDLAFANTRSQLIANSTIKPVHCENEEAESDIFVIYTEKQQKDVATYLFSKCVKDLEGKRVVRILSLEEYQSMENSRITEVSCEDDEDIGFSVSDFFTQLGPYRDDTILVYSHVLDSTQTFLNTYCAGYMNIVCTADIQTNGHGRKSNTWVSPVGALMFSYKSALQNGDYVSLMQYLEALVMCQAVNEMEGVRGIDVNIKWPNDVYVNRRVKICGILCQSVFSNGMFDITSGIGINVSNRKPTTCIEQQVKDRTGRVVHLSRGELLGRFMRIWNRCFPRFSREGLKPYLSDYYALWMHSNQPVNVANEDGTTDSVIIKGIDETGFLIAVDAKGNTRKLMPDGNSFNFLEGLISKKK